MNDDAQFEAWLGQSLSQVRKGPCPDASLLAGFVGHDLTAEQELQVEDHIATCGYCDLIVVKMESFQRALPRPNWTRWLWLPPALAAAGLVGWMLRPPQSMTALPAIQFAQVLQLDAQRGAPTPPREIGTGPLALAFFIPIVPGHRYSATIANSVNANVGQADVTNCDEQGHCLLLCDRKDLPAGNYTLRVKDKESAASPFAFSFKL